MKIDKVTITGADDGITYSDLIEIQDQFPFVEWGILFSKSKSGESRYPCEEHRATNFGGVLNLSAHFCGWWAKQILEEGNFELIHNLPKQYSRVQLNYNFRNSTSWNLLPLLDYLRKSDRNIILQYNNSNKDVLDQLIDQNYIPNNLDFLYDSSGGRGTIISGIKPPIHDFYTGYAGGLDVNNIDAVCSDINRFENMNSVWIDLESGARTNNNFDLIKVRQILFKCSYHVNR